MQGNPWDVEAAQPAFLRWDAPKCVLLTKLEQVDAARKQYRAQAQLRKGEDWKDVVFFAPASLNTQILALASYPYLFVKYVGKKVSNKGREMHSFVVRGYRAVE